VSYGRKLPLNANRKLIVVRNLDNIGDLSRRIRLWQYGKYLIGRRNIGDTVNGEHRLRKEVDRYSTSNGIRIRLAHDKIELISPLNRSA
jgi:hypothetical protein